MFTADNNNNWDKNAEKINLYLKDLLYFHNIPASSTAILYEMLKKAFVENNRLQIITNTTVKKRIQQSTHFKSISGINNAISKFVKEQILERIDYGLYIFNPDYFGTENWNNLINLTCQIDYKEQRKLIVNFKFKKGDARDEND